MANAFSVAADFGDYIQPINTELVNFVLSSKQQKYDYNVAKIDETIAEFGLDLERQKDKDYVIGKLNTVLDSVNAMGKMDLSNGNVTRNIQQQIRGTLDDRMIDAAVSTKNYRNFVGSLQQIRQNDPESYSDINAAYAMERGGVNAWLQEDTDSLGSVSYTPYINVNENVTKGIKDLKQFSPERTIDIPFQDPNTGVQRIIRKKVKDLNEAEIRSYVMSNLDSNSQNQLKINGWANFNGISDQDLIDFAGNYKNQRMKNYDDAIGVLRQQLKSAPSYQSEDIRNRINVLQSEKQSFNSTMENIGSDRDNIGRVIMQEQLVDDVSRAYADTSVSFELKTDEGYYKQAKLELDKVLAQIKINKANATKTPGLGNPQIRQTEGTAIHEESFDPEERTNDIIEEREANANRIAQDIVGGFNDEMKQLFNSTKQSNPELNDAEVIQKMGIDPVYTDGNGDERLFSEVMFDLTDTYQDAKASYETTMEQSFESNLDDIYEEITSQGLLNNNEFPLIQDDGSLVRMDEFLAENNISLEDFKANVGGIKEKVKKSLYLNKALSVATEDLIPNTSSDLSALDEPDSYFMSSNTFDSIDNYIKAMDSNDDIFNYLEFRDSQGNVITREDSFNFQQAPVRIIPKTKTAKELFDFFEARNTVFTDARVSDEGGLNEIISFDTPQFKQRLTENFAAQSNRNLVIDPNLGKGGKELSDVHVSLQNFLNSKGMIDIDKKLPFIVQESLFNPNEVVVFQNKEDASPITISKVELGNELQIDLTGVGGDELTINREVVNRDIFPINTDKAAHQDRQRVVAGMIQRQEIWGDPGLSKTGLREAVKFINGYNTPSGEDRSSAGLLADTVINGDFENLSVAYRPGARDGGHVTVMNKTTQEEIISYPVNRPEINIARKTVRYNPQIFIAQTLESMLNSFSQESTNSELFLKLLESQQKQQRQPNGATN